MKQVVARGQLFLPDGPLLLVHQVANTSSLIRGQLLNQFLQDIIRFRSILSRGRAQLCMTIVELKGTLGKFVVLCANQAGGLCLRQWRTVQAMDRNHLWNLFAPQVCIYLMSCMPGMTNGAGTRLVKPYVSYRQHMQEHMPEALRDFSKLPRPLIRFRRLGRGGRDEAWVKACLVRSVPASFSAAA